MATKPRAAKYRVTLYGRRARTALVPPYAPNPLPYIVQLKLRLRGPYPRQLPRPPRATHMHSGMWVLRANGPCPVRYGAAPTPTRYL